MGIWGQIEARVRVMDPGRLLPRPYLRREGEGGGLLAASVRELGVVEPLVCRPAEGGLEVVLGQRRLLAALEAGEPVPVVVLPLSREEAEALVVVSEVVRRPVWGSRLSALGPPARWGAGLEELLALLPLLRELERDGRLPEEAALRVGEFASWLEEYCLVRVDGEAG